MQTLSIRPFDRSWALTADFFDNEMIFASGQRAEDAARALGQKVAEAGEPVQIEIWIRDGTLAGRFVCSPPEQASI